MNLTRIKFFGLFICSLCRVQTFCFEKLAASFDADARVDSSLRRIQRFISEYLNAFKALKTSGFNIEDTHLTDIDRIEKLFALVLVAFVWSYKIYCL